MYNIGSHYWKSSRKIKAVTRNHFDLLNAAADLSVHDYETGQLSDDDFMPPKSKRKKQNVLPHHPSNYSREPLESRVTAMEDTFKELRSWTGNEKQELQREVTRYKETHKELETELNVERQKTSKIKNALNQVKDNFCCIICKSMPSGGCVLFPCCNVLGTCYQCLQQWLLESEICPHCRAPMEIGTCMLIPEANQFIQAIRLALSEAQVVQDVIEVQ